MYTLVNICGTARSGNTMLDLILGNSDDTFSCGEVYAWFHPYRQHHFKINCSYGNNPCQTWEKIKDEPENEFHAAIFKTLGVSFVIDSSKDLCWLIDTQTWAFANNLKSINLVIWKDLLELAYS